MCIKTYYSVLVCEYAKKHFIKSFEKKYKSVWNKTFETIENMLSRIEIFSKTSKVNKIHMCDSWYIAKCEFNIEWIRISTHASWNRIIVYVNELTLEVKILLIYAKTDVAWTNETTWWEQEVKNNHKEIADLFPWL